MWRVDLHTHTSASSDSRIDPAALVERAREIGLNKVAITDHNTIEGALSAQQLAPDLVIVGEEIEVSTGGELIAYFLTEVIPRGLPVEEALRQLKAQGAVISISHPLDRLRGSALGEEMTLQIIDQVEALEVFNARCLRPDDNRKAADLANRFAKAPTAGSDAHTLPELGAGYLVLPPFKSNPEAFRASLARATPGGHLSGIWPHFASTFSKFVK